MKNLLYFLTWAFLATRGAESYEECSHCEPFTTNVTTTAITSLLSEAYDIFLPERNLGRLRYRGNNGRFSRYPLRECEGDCDRDRDCLRHLKCKQRRGREAVPGCRGSGDRGRDYCYDPKHGGPSPKPPSGRSYRLRLFWKRGYFWQETYKEFKYCMVCRNRCRPGAGVMIDKCKGDNTKWRVVGLPGRGDHITVQGSKPLLCIERIGRYATHLDVCNPNESRQRWLVNSGASRFDIRPVAYSDRCLTQHHHPKPKEGVFAETCQKAHAHTTGYWNRY